MTTWNTIQQELKKQGARTRSDSRGAFWEDFSARARLVPQLAPQPAHHSALWASLAMAGAVGLLAILLWPSSAIAELTHVTSLQVDLPHTGAMILNVVSPDGQDSAAIVWISGLEEPND